jgi:hypothetical protein
LTTPPDPRKKILNGEFDGVRVRIEISRLNERQLNVNLLAATEFDPDGAPVYKLQNIANPISGALVATFVQAIAQSSEGTETRNQREDAMTDFFNDRVQDLERENKIDRDVHARELKDTIDSYKRLLIRAEAVANDFAETNRGLLQSVEKYKALQIVTKERADDAELQLAAYRQAPASGNYFDLGPIW